MTRADLFSGRHAMRETPFVLPKARAIFANARFRLTLLHYHAAAR